MIQKTSIACHHGGWFPYLEFVLVKGFEMGSMWFSVAQLGG